MGTIEHCYKPIQIITYTDKDGMITPLRFRFENDNSELLTVEVEKVVANTKKQLSTSVEITVYGNIYNQKRFFDLRYEYTHHTWNLTSIRT